MNLTLKQIIDANIEYLSFLELHDAVLYRTTSKTRINHLYSLYDTKKSK